MTHNRYLHDTPKNWVNKHMLDFGQWMNLKLSSIIHDNICLFIHNQCCYKNYHIDVEYHMILYII